MSFAPAVQDALWMNAWSVIPLAIAAAALVRVMRPSPANRHAVWLVVLAWFFAPALLPRLPFEFGTAPHVSALELTASADAGRDEPGPVATSMSTWPAPPVTSTSPLEAITPPPPVVTMDSRGSQREAPPPAYMATPRRAFSPQPVRIVAPRTNAAPGVASPGSDPPAVVAPESTFASTEIAVPAAECGETVAVPDAQTPTDSSPSPTWFQSLRSLGASAIERTKNAWNGWVATLAVIEGALARLPIMPPLIWIGGALLLIAVTSLRCVWFAFQLRRAAAAPGWVQREAHGVARALGLSSVPEILMTERAVSPLVWALWRPRVVLPTRLWASLDRAGRRAILCHELAHLRRRDHWVLWLELLATAVYWWHPLMWWVQPRAQEADASCDAWVTWLMPQGRRAYAERFWRRKLIFQNETPPWPAFPWRRRMPARWQGG